jgi:glycosyltransferase involved in cell wall biosynthesis
MIIPLMGSNNLYKDILVIDAAMVTPDRDAGSLRMYNFLKILRSLSYRVTYATSDLETFKPSEKVFEDLRIDVLTKPIHNSIEEYLKREGDRFCSVVLSRISVADRYIDFVRMHSRSALILFDTVDLHFLREFRGAKITHNVNLLKRAMKTKRRELAVAQKADITLVVSPVERDLLKEESPDINVHVVSNIHELFDSVVPFSRRKDILFIGSFHHHPNVDAMLYFFDEIYPLFRKKVEGIKIYIVGSNPPAAIQSLDSDNVIVTDYVPDVAPYFNHCRLSIAPLRYGAGVKGKVLLSMSCGVPVVASSVAAEGVPATQGRDCLIADTPHDFSDRILEVFHNETLWNRISENGRRLVADNYSFDAARSKIEELLMCERANL